MLMESQDVRRAQAHGSLPDSWEILEGADVPACELDGERRYRRVNTGWDEFLQGDTFQRGPHEISVTGRDFLSDVREDRRERWSTALSAMLDGRLGQFADEMVEQDSIGERVVLMTASPILAEGGVSGVLCMRYDVTPARLSAATEERLTDVLLTARKLQHFLGNQLALTLGYVELLTFDPRLPEELRDRLDEALRGVIEATETLSRLRLLTRLEVDPQDSTITDHLAKE